MKVQMREPRHSCRSWLRNEYRKMHEPCRRLQR